MNHIPDMVAREMVAKGLDNHKLVVLISELIDEIGESRLWVSRSNDDLRDLLYRAMICYGSTNLESLVPFILPLYRHFMAESNVSQRLELEGIIRGNVEQEILSLNALLPFIYIDDNRSVVSTAVIDMCMIGVPTAEDSLAWPRRLTDDLARGMMACKGGVVGGFLCLGDARVLQLLTPLKECVAEEDIADAAWCTTSQASIDAFEFWLSWAESLEQRKLTETSAFGNVMAALILLQRAANGRFLCVKRNFGYLFNPLIDAPLEILAEYSDAEISLKFGERLIKLANCESEPKLALEVLNSLQSEPTKRHNNNTSSLETG